MRTTGRVRSVVRLRNTTGNVQWWLTI